MRISDQLELLGLEGAKRQAMAGGATPAEKHRLARRVEMAHEMLSAMPTIEDLAFLHSGLAQTCLPHSKLADDQEVWRRQSGRFSLLVEPGRIDDGRVSRHVGVPYGSRARLIMLHLQSEGLKSRTVSPRPLPISVLAQPRPARLRRPSWLNRRHSRAEPAHRPVLHQHAVADR